LSAAIGDVGEDAIAGQIEIESFGVSGDGNAGLKSEAFGIDNRNARGVGCIAAAVADEEQMRVRVQHHIVRILRESDCSGKFEWSALVLLQVALRSIGDIEGLRGCLPDETMRFPETGDALNNFARRQVYYLDRMVPGCRHK